MWTGSSHLLVIMTSLSSTCLQFVYAADTTCNLTITSEANRLNALGSHTVARGLLQSEQIYDNAGDSYETAVNLYDFIYDCEYESIADEFVQGCQQTPPSTPPEGHALNFKGFPYNGGATYNRPSEIAIDEWRDQSTKIKATNMFDEGIRELSNMLNWRTLRVGCSVQSCGGGIIASVACVYEKPALSPGDQMYEVGKPCSADEECTAYEPAKCDVDGMLCILDTISSITSSTSTSTTSTTVLNTTLSTSSLATTNANPNTGINQICPSNGDMNDRIRQKATDMHNYRRSQLAKGDVAKFNGNKLPTAANMLKLRYDCELERLAIAQAKSCSGSQSALNSTPNVKNTYVIADAAVPYRVNAMEEAIKYWWKQIRLQQQSIGMAVTFKQNHVNQPIRFFTMMAWATTRGLGCAVARCSSNFFVVCQYRPGGNVVDASVYSRGTPCSQCPAGAYCSTPLCVRT